MVNKSKAEDYLSKIPSIKGISGVRFFEGQKSLLNLFCLPTHINRIDNIKSLMDWDSLFIYLNLSDITEKFRDPRIKLRINYELLEKESAQNGLLRNMIKKSYERNVF